MNSSHHILQYFSPELFSADLKATTKDEALRELVALVSTTGGLRDPALLLEMLERRESLGSTGLGKGVAIPHGRSLAVVNLRVAFAVSKKGVEFEAHDEKPVKLFFLIVAPPQDKRNEYLPLLGKIAELVQDAKIRQRLAKVTTFEDLTTVMEEAFPVE